MMHSVNMGYTDYGELSGQRSQQQWQWLYVTQ